MQRVAELVEQRDDFRVRQQRRRVAGRRVEVADEVARPALALWPFSFARLTAAAHPRAAALVRAREEIREEAADQRAVAALELVVAHAVVPDVGRRRLGDREVEQRAAELEQAVEHARQREVRPQLLLGELELLLLQALGVERDVPRLELAAGVVA